MKRITLKHLPESTFPGVSVGRSGNSKEVGQASKKELSCQCHEQSLLYHWLPRFNQIDTRK